MKLYSFYLSSAAYRIRIALNLKGIGFDTVPVDLMRPGTGAQHDAGYDIIHPQRMVPALDIMNVAGGSTGEPAENILIQSVAILEYLEEQYPEPPLLPRRPEDRARVRAMVQAVVSDIHPLVTLRIIKQLSSQLEADQTRIDAWLRHWITSGFQALEQMIGDDGHCFGGYTTLADVCLIPQVATARRYGVPLDAFPKICKVADLCGSLPAFAMAHPSRQPDAPQPNSAEES